MIYSPIERKHFLQILSLLLLLPVSLLSLENGLAHKPPMGWISWVRFTCDIDCSNGRDCINYDLYLRTGKAMKSGKFLDLGYQYVNIDDCWSEKDRDENNNLVPNKERFKDGIKKLAKEMNEMGIKLGIYGDCGYQTCARYPAQLSKDDANFFDKDAETFYSWNIESFKFDGCFINPSKSEVLCPGMSDAIKKLKNDRNPILLTCEWPYYMMSKRHTNESLEVDWNLVKEKCNLWRYYEDIYDSWLSVLSIIDSSIKIQNTILKYHGPGGWFDPDQLIVGGFGLSKDQARAHMAIWSLWSAPLFMSNDLDKLVDWEKSLLQNKSLIDVNQDPLGIWAQMVHEQDDDKWSVGKLQVFVKPIEPKRTDQRCPDFVIAYLYRGSLGNSVKLSVSLEKIFSQSSEVIREANKRRDHEEWTNDCLARLNSTSTTKIEKFNVVDLIDNQKDSQQTLGLQDNLKLLVNPTGVRVVKLLEP